MGGSFLFITCKGPSICSVIKKGGWGRPNDYVITQNWSGILVMFEYRVVGGVQIGQSVDYVIYGWSLN